MNTKGFTLLEVSLFLAVSGALGLIAFVGLGPRLRNVRFTQSIRLIESTINAQFAASQSGQNNRPANFICQSSGGGLSVSALADNPVGSSEDCVINGKVVYFENNKMTFYSVISRRSPLPVSGVDCLTTSSLSELQRCYTPRLTGTGVGDPPESSVINYTSDVGARFSSGAPSYRGYGYVQSPNGVEQYPFFFMGSVAAKNLTDSNTTTLNDPLLMCFELSNRQAQLSVGKNTIKPDISFKGCTI
ncbi:hypothetical protein KA021_00030 [Candidatus Saccharibacteria bacterium]|nr:hypothetical protein [Candidatus Saccharibacteria bacterium]